MGGSGVIVIVGVFRAAFIMVHPDAREALLSGAWLWCFTRAGWPLFAVGYFGFVLAQRRSRVRPEDATEDETCPENPRGDPVGWRFVITTLVVVTGGVILLEFLQFIYFDCSLIPESIVYGIPVFLPICGFPFAVYAVWRLPWRRSWRIVTIILVLMFCLSLVTQFGTVWLVTHMAP